MPSVHHPDEVAAFQQDGDRRLVYARYRDNPNGQLFHLADGRAAELRAYTREQLECPMPDCDRRQLSAVSRFPRRRDGFTHGRGAGGHAPESMFHMQAKAALVAWAKDRCPDACVTAEMGVGQQERIADVLVRWPSGERVAFEVQYSAMTPAAFRARHESYQRMGITDVWLLGHQGSHRPRAGGARMRFVLPRLGDLAHTIVDAGLPLLWINPVDALVATAWQYGVPVSWMELGARPQAFPEPQDRLPIPPSSDRTDLTFGHVALDACGLTPAGVLHPLWQQAERGVRALAERNQARRQAAEEELARREQARLLRAAEGAQLPASPLPASRAVRPPKCRACGLVLDERLVDYGYHIGPDCDPAFRVQPFAPTSSANGQAVLF